MWIAPIGHIISMIAPSYFEPYGLTFASYTLAGVVVGFVSFAVIVLVFRYIFCMDVSAIRSFDPTSLKRSISVRWTAEQIWCAGIYLFLVVLWLLPSLLQPVWPSLYHYLNSLTNCMPLVLGVVLMSLIPVNGKPLMDFKQEIKDGAPWGAVFAVSAAMLLGAALSDADAGIPDVLCSLLEPLFANVPAMIFVAAIGILCCLMTNFSSDTVTLLLFGTITLTLRESGELIGGCGLTIQNIHGELLPEIGCHIRRDRQRQGYAAEAARACRDWAFANTPFRQLFSYLKRDNLPSAATARANGMALLGEFTDGEGEQTVIYGISRAEWNNQKISKENVK